MNIDKLNSWRRTHFSAEITPELDGKEVTVFGWVQELRDLGGIIFIILQDREGTVQITIPRKKIDEKIVSKATMLKTRYSVGVKGVVQKTKLTPREVEIIPREIRILSEAEQLLPLDVSGKTPAQLTARLDARALDLSSQENIAIFKIEHCVLQIIRKFLSEKGFLEVHTPRIIASATEGGAALFPVTYYNQEAYLAQSPQLYKEQLVLSLEKVFEIGSFFRAEESHTRRHLSEFISIDIEEAFATAEDVMQILEQLIYTVCSTVKEKCLNELQTLKWNIEIPTLPFKRYTYEEIFNELKKEGIEIPWGTDIPTPACRKLGKLHPYFYFITEWPATAKPFYIQQKEDNPNLTEGFDLMWRWMEIASGGTRVHSKKILIKKLQEQGLNPDSFKHHLKAFDYGMPPHAGWAVGFERLIMLLTGKKNIREVVLFPRDRFRLTP
jgi:aspartyl-tRNA synthetase